MSLIDTGTDEWAQLGKSLHDRKEPTMPEVEEEFRHTVEVWIVGDLKKVLRASRTTLS